MVVDKIQTLLKGPLNIDPKKAGKTLLGLNAISMIAAAASDTYAAAVDKDTSAEDKKFLIPAGVATGVAKIGIYYTMTTTLINKLQGKEIYDKKGNLVKTIKGLADYVLEEMQKNNTFDTNALNYANKSIKKAQKGFLGTGLFKKSKEYVEQMQTTLLANNKATNHAKELYSSNLRSGFGVLGAFIGAVVGSAILTPIIRDVSAWAIQKVKDKKTSESTEYINNKQTPTLNNFMALTQKK